MDYDQIMQWERGTAAGRVAAELASRIGSGEASGVAPWWIPDPAQVARVNAVLLRFDARRTAEAAHADIGLKFVPPVLSDSATWEATWDGGQARADTDTELYALVCERLSIAAGGDQ
jgi:hypothetical protein